MRHLRILLAGLGLAIALSCLSGSAPQAWARGGGGHTYSGGGGGRSGGGGFGGGGFGSGGGYGGGYYGGRPGGVYYYNGDGSGGSVLGTLIFLCVMLIIISVVVKFLTAGNQLVTDFSTIDGGARRAVRRQSLHRMLAQVQQDLDPAFSLILFQDFCYSLYADAHHARGTQARPRLRDFSSYLSARAQEDLRHLSVPGHEPVEVLGVVIGACRIDELSLVPSADGGAPGLQISVSFEANYTERTARGEHQSWYAQETWTFVRAGGLKSRPPAATRVITCPACGAPPDLTDTGQCRSCGNRIDPGAMDWGVRSIRAARSARPPLLTTTVEEQGNELPTILDPYFAASSAQYTQAHPEFSWKEFEARVVFVFMQVQKAWTERRWEEVRPFESDRLFQNHRYWIEEYQRQHLINELTDIRITRLEPVKLEEDAYYSAITVRVHASMKDCTRDERRKLVSGDPRRDRPFTEYWTFIRGRSAKAPAKPAALLSCPSCGAELKVNMAGQCAFCQAKITQGDFDWVLSQIEQDEAYS